MSTSHTKPPRDLSVPVQEMNPKRQNTHVNKRSGARVAAVQALYAMEVTGKGVLEVIPEFEAFWLGQEVDEVPELPAESKFFQVLIHGVVEHQHFIDSTVDKALAKGWPLKRIEAVLRAIMRCGTFELKYRPDIPTKVVITEYVDVTHAFFSTDESGLINAVLDAIGKEVREVS
jgi:transcription antitermination protein NusB